MGQECILWFWDIKKHKNMHSSPAFSSINKLLVFLPQYCHLYLLFPHSINSSKHYTNRAYKICEWSNLLPQSTVLYIYLFTQFQILKVHCERTIQQSKIQYINWSHCSHDALMPPHQGSQGSTMCWDTANIEFLKVAWDFVYCIFQLSHSQRNVKSWYSLQLGKESWSGSISAEWSC